MFESSLRTAQQTRATLDEIKARAELLKAVQAFLLKVSAYPPQKEIDLNAFSPASQASRIAILLANEIGFSATFLDAVRKDDDLYQAFLADLVSGAWTSNAQHPLSKCPVKDDLLELTDKLEEHALYIPDLETSGIRVLPDLYDFLSSHFSAYMHNSIENEGRHYSVITEFQAQRRESLDHLGITLMRAAVLDGSREIFVVQGYLVDADPDIDVSDFYRQMDANNQELADIAHGILTDFLQYPNGHTWGSIGNVFAHPTKDRGQALLVIGYLEGDDDRSEEPLLRLLIQALPGLLAEFNRFNLENGFISGVATPSAPERLHNDIKNRVPELYYPMKVRGLNLVTIRNPIVMVGPILKVCDSGPEREDVIDGATLSYIETRNAFDDINITNGDTHNGGESPDPEGLRPFCWICNEPPVEDSRVIRDRRRQHYAMADDEEDHEEECETN